MPVAQLVLRAPPDLWPPAWLALMGRAAVCAGGRRPAREPSALRASLGASTRCPARPCRPRGGLQSGEACASEWPGLARPPARSPHASLTARSGRSRGPPWPCRHPPAPRPCPATARGYRSLALRSLRRPPHQWCQVSDVARCVGLLFGQAPPPPVGVTGVSRVEFLGWSGACCYKRRQSDGFLAENGRYRSVRAMTSRKSRM